MANHDFNTRWTPKRKAALVAELLLGLTTAEEIAVKHGISLEELTSWRANYERAGVGALKATLAPMIRISGILV